MNIFGMPPSNNKDQNTITQRYNQTFFSDKTANFHQSQDKSDLQSVLNKKKINDSLERFNQDNLES